MVTGKIIAKGLVFKDDDYYEDDQTEEGEEDDYDDVQISYLFYNLLNNCCKSYSSKVLFLISVCGNTRNSLKNPVSNPGIKSWY